MWRTETRWPCTDERGGVVALGASQVEDRIGQERTGEDRTGQDRTGQESVMIILVDNVATVYYTLPPPGVTANLLSPVNPG